MPGAGTAEVAVEYLPGRGEGDTTDGSHKEQIFRCERVGGRYASACAQKGIFPFPGACSRSLPGRILMGPYPGALGADGNDKPRSQLSAFALFFRVAQVRRWLAESPISDPADGPEAGLAKEYSYLSLTLFTWP